MPDKNARRGSSFSWEKLGCVLYIAVVVFLILWGGIRGCEGTPASSEDPGIEWWDRQGRG